MTETAKYILKTLAYFDIFHYPLSNNELLQFHYVDTTQPLIDEALEYLLQNNIVFKIDTFYALHNDTSLAEKRIKANKFAVEQMVIAHKAARILSGFPYVKGLAISGSLSKNYGSDKTDVDFFIITTANRLWIARTIMHLYKKFTFLTGKSNWFCMNYYVDEAVHEIEEKNIFTSLEIITLLPMYGKTALDNFFLANQWANNYFPVHCPVTDKAGTLNKGLLARLVEKLFNNNIGNAIDNRLMKITAGRWKKKVDRNKKNKKGNPLGMIINKHCSKPDPKNFQDKVVKAYEAKLETVLQPKTVMSRVD